MAEAQREFGPGSRDECRSRGEVRTGRPPLPLIEGGPGSSLSRVTRSRALLHRTIWIAVVLTLGATMLGAVLGLTACAGQDPVVARVGDSVIHRSQVEHWTGAMARGAMPGDGLGRTSSESDGQAAVGFLIAARWMIGEAEKLGLRASNATVERTLEERIESEGTGEFGRDLRSTGRTVADVKLEIELELASEAIHGRLVAQAGRITPREVAGYYKRNARRLGSRERRETDLVEGLPSRSTASALVRRIRRDAGFTGWTNYESLRLQPALDREQAAVLRAIFRARAGVVSGPVRLDKHWADFIVREIVRARLLPFAEVRDEAARLLAAERERALTARFVEAYRNGWTARTSCNAGFIVQGCARYEGPARAERALFAGR